MIQARIFRVAAGLWLLGWYVNAPGNPGFLHNFADALRFPILHDAFPWLLRAPAVALVIYLAPLLVTLALLWPSARAMRGSALLMLASALFACLHLETSNDATFVTSLWTAAWLTWLVWQAPMPSLALARGLGHGVIGLLFLGGLVGKLTGEYTSGAAFYGLYFQRGGDWPYPWLRNNLSPEAVGFVALAFSRAVITGEAMLAAAPLLPTRVVGVVYVVSMLAMMLARNVHLLSVLAAPLGIILALELLRREAV